MGVMHFADGSDEFDRSDVIDDAWIKSWSLSNAYRRCSVDVQRANVPKVDVKEKRSFEERSRNINERIMLVPVATSRRSRQVRFIHFSSPLLTRWAFLNLPSCLNYTTIEG